MGYTGSYLLHMEPLIFVVACGVWFPDQGSNPSPLHCEHRVLAPGPPRKSLEYSLLFLVNLAKSLLIFLIIQKLITQFYWFFFYSLFHLSLLSSLYFLASASFGYFSLIYLFIFGSTGSLLPHRVSLVVASRVYSLVPVHWFLTGVASFIAEQELCSVRSSVTEVCGPCRWGLQALKPGLSNCGNWAQLLHSM